MIGNKPNNKRWKQRFENFEKALLLLRTPFDEKALDQFSMLEKEGIIQRFEFTFELVWKSLKDYLENNGIILEQITPRQTIKQAFAAKIIKDGQLWIDMLNERNMLFHTYNESIFATAFENISKKYLAELEELFLFLKEKSLINE